jgi:GNAT superfamily N-acetyltransferase
MKLKVRRATVEDIPQMVEIDREAWWPEVAFKADQLRSQIEKYAEGVLVAEVEDRDPRLVGTICGLRVPSSFAENIHSWAEGTGNGYFTTHSPQGDVAFGANLSVRPEFARMGIGDKLFAHAAAVVVRHNMRCIVLGARLPGLANYNKQRAELGQPRIRGEEYAALRDEKGRILDPELRFYLRQPFMEMARVLPDYFPDPESENYGVVLRWRNPLYKFHVGWVYRIPVLGKLLPRLVALLVEAAV